MVRATTRQTPWIGSGDWLASGIANEVSRTIAMIVLTVQYVLFNANVFRRHRTRDPSGLGFDWCQPQGGPIELERELGEVFLA